MRISSSDAKNNRQTEGLKFEVDGDEIRSSINETKQGKRDYTSEIKKSRATLKSRKSVLSNYKQY